MKTTMVKKISIVALWVLMFSGVIALVAFTNKAIENQQCKEVIITVLNNEENSFIDNKEILQMCIDQGDSLTTQKLKQINTYKIEKNLSNHTSVEEAQVYTTANAELYIQVKQRTPILRIIDYKGEGFYIDSEGKAMPLSSSFTARVPVFTGNIYCSYYTNFFRNLKKENLPDDSLNNTSRLLNSIYTIGKKINQNAFINSLTEQVNFVDNKFILVPKVGNQIIILGDAKNLDKKFRKLYNFYTQAIPKVGWNKYNVINLSYNNQIVCTLNK
jgi:cell division protein FtsQ